MQTMIMRSPPGEAGRDLNEQTAAVSRSAFARHGLSALDVLMCFGVLASMCAYTPFFFTWFWAPRMAIILVAVLPGLVALGCLVRDRDRAALFAAGLLGWAVISALFSDSPWLSFRGTVAQNTFVLAYMAAFGLWALAHFMSGAGRRLMLATVLVGVTLNAAVGAAQMFFQLEDRNLGLMGGRSLGLTPNPIELAALMLVGIFICLVRISSFDSQIWRCPETLGLFGFGAVLAFTSTRVALAAFVIVGVGAVLRRRDRRITIGMAISTAGVVVGTAVARLLGSTSDALSRAGAVNAGGRGDWWLAGWHAFIDRPLLGWGVGRFRSAIQGELSFASVAANSDSQAIPDAHNIIVNMTVDLGIVGLLLFLGFAICVGRRSTGVYSLALIAVPIIWLLQPIAQTTLILYMVLLGITVTSKSTGFSSRRGLPPSVKSWVWVAATVIGVGAASWLMVAEYRLAEAALDLDGEAFEGAASMYLGDPIVSDLGVSIWIGSLGFDETAQDKIVAQMRRTVELEPTRAYWHARLALGLAQQENWTGARAAAARALELQPTSIQAWTALLYIADETDDAALRSDAMDAVCRLELDSCEEGPAVG